MKSIKLLLLLCFIIRATSAQTLTHTKYLISFKDKNQSSFVVSDPDKFLSQSSIQRRSAQNIAIDTYDLPVNANYIDSVVSKGAKLICKSKWLNAAAVEILDTNVLIAINNLSCVKKTEFIKKKLRPGDGGVKPMFKAETMAPIAMPINKRVSKTDDFNYGMASNQIEMMHGEYLHNRGFCGQSMVIAVLDAGFLNANSIAAFDSLWINKQILGCRDFVKGDTMVFEDDSHGTMVLSTMGANLPGQMIGTAPKAKYWLLRTEDAATEYRIEEVYWVVGAEFADSVGADVINSSLGYTEFDDPSENYTYADMNGKNTICSKGATTAARKGMLVVVSAGNEGNGSWHYIGTPGDADSILTVGAVNDQGSIASFSSRGPSADGRVKPNVAAQGADATVASPYGDVFGGNGTSFSSPIMAGMVACFWQAHKDMTNMQVLDTIQKISSTYMNPNTDIGYGIPNFSLSPLVNIGKKISVPSIVVSNNPYVENGSPWAINLNSSITQKANVCLVDMLGKIVAGTTLSLSEGANNNIELPFKNINAGTYLLKINMPALTENAMLQAKVIKF